MKYSTTHRTQLRNLETHTDCVFSVARKDGKKEKRGINYLAAFAFNSSDPGRSRS